MLSSVKSVNNVPLETTAVGNWSLLFTTEKLQQRSACG